MMRAVVSVVAAVVVRPRYWPTSIRVVKRLARSAWWKRPPFLPVPSWSYVRFRIETQYGTVDDLGSAVMRHRLVNDVLKYLRWVHEWDRSRERFPVT